ncbi:MAG: hypothetical protein R6V75_09995 [Bacteroidales bacterium]
MKYFQVNWVDGMKINKEHFISGDHSVTERLADARLSAINRYNYGLLPAREGEDAPLRINLSIDNQQVLRIKIFECQAVTPGGHRISLSGSPEPKQFKADLPEALYEWSPSREENIFISLSVNPFKLVPTGDIDPAEEPPRHPLAIPEYRLNLIPESQVGKKESGLNLLMVGKIHVGENGPELDKEYIPPCHCVFSHAKLVAIHSEFDRFLSTLEPDLVTILKKIGEKEQTNILATTLASIAGPLLQYLSNTILHFRWNVPVGPPLVMLETIARSARIIKNYLDASPGKAREELLNYLSEWCTLKQGDLETVLHRAVNFEYDHSDMTPAFRAMTEYTGMIGPLFNKLSTLEYIGKKKETSIFVKEQTVNKKSFLAD